jgi:ABC-type proline/glycine betaine transport system permease subunit
VLFLERRDVRRQEIQRQRLAARDLDRPASQSAQIFDLRPHPLGFGDPAVGIAREHFARGRQPHAARTALAMIMCIFPIVVNVATGLAATEPELQDVMKTLRATKLEILWNVGLPRTMPYFFASLKVAATLAFVGTVISETVASNRGIGNLMMIASSSFDVPLVFAGLFILAALGVALYVIFSLIEGRVTGWAVRSDNFAAGG